MIETIPVTCGAALVQRNAEHRGRLRVMLVVFLLLPGTGCSTHADRLREARRSFFDGQLEMAAEQLQKQADRYPRDADVLAMDLAVVHLLQGRPDQAESSLREVRDRLDHLEQADAVEAGLSMLTDDQRRAYAGEDYERVLVRVMLALSNLMVDGQDAEAYSLQINAKQQQLQQLAEKTEGQPFADAYQPLAIGPYLRGVLREATHGNYDDAARSYAQVVSWQPGYRFAADDLQRVESGAHSRPGHGVLYVFALVGRGPYKEEVAEVPTSAALLIADRILSAAGDHELPPTIAPIKVPKIVVPARDLDGVAVQVGGQRAGQTHPICDVADLAVRQHQSQMPRIMARAVVRRVVKKGTVYAAKDYLDVSNPWTDLAMTAAGVAWEATESADTRCWGLLPREIQVLRIELPAGSHPVKLVGQRGSRLLSGGLQETVTIEDGRNTYVLACFPTAQPVGELLVNTP